MSTLRARRHYRRAMACTGTRSLVPCRAHIVPFRAGPGRVHQGGPVWSLDTKLDTRTLNLKYLDPDPKYPNPHYPMSSSDSESYYPNLYWVIRVSTPGTRTNRNRNTSQRSAKSRTGASPISRGPSPTTVGCLLGFGASLTHVLTCRSRVKLKHKH
jgi:hypothetical protein